MTIASTVPTYVSFYIYNDESAYQLVLLFLFRFCILTFQLVSVHMIITKFGMIFVDSDVICKGND